MTELDVGDEEEEDEPEVRGSINQIGQVDKFKHFKDMTNAENFGVKTAEIDRADSITGRSGRPMLE